MKGARILIIDDSAFMRAVLKDILLKKQNTLMITDALEIYEADGKESALKIFKEVKPTIILLDIVMKESELEGIEFIKELKDHFDHKRIIMITSMGLTSLKKKCESYGINNFIQKPFDEEMVIAVINRVLTGK